MEKFVLLRWLKRAPGAVGHLYTLFFVLVSWTIFAIEDFGQLGEYLKVMFGLGGVPLIDGAFKYYAANYLPVLCISALAATPLGAAVYRRLNVRTAHILGAVLILAGLFVTLVSTLGLFRLDTVLKRMHAAALADTMGVLLTAAGLMVLCGLSAHSLKLVAVVVFVWLTSPIMAHLIANTELLTKQKMDTDEEEEEEKDTEE